MSSKKRFYMLDALRGLAALIVLLLHLGGRPSLIVSGGYLAVDLFFVLSGFVLAQAYGEQNLSFASFLGIRLIRLYPLYICGTVIGVLAFAIQSPEIGILSSLGFNAFFLPTPFYLPAIVGETGSLFPFNPAAWSLFYELAVNIAWFALIPLLTTKRLHILCVLAAALLVAATYVHHSVGLGTSWPSFWGGFCRAPYSFFMGVAAYRLWRSGAVKLRIPGWLIIILTLGVFVLPPILWLHAGAILFLIPLIVLAGAMIDPSKSLVPLCALLGNMSYAVYAIHTPIIALVNLAVRAVLAHSSLANTIIGDHVSLAITPLTLLAAIGGALLLDKYYDTPLRAWLTQLSKRGG